MRVFKFGTSLENDRPEIDFEHPENKKNRWLLVGDVLRGLIPPEEYASPHIIVEHPEATEWHCYFSGSMTPLWSARAVEVLKPYTGGRFRFLEAYLNGSLYYFPMPIEDVDCLDLPRSRYRTIPSSPHRVMDVQRYVFRTDRLTDPMIFTVPELRGQQFATTSIPSIIEEHGLRGFRCDLLYDSEAG